jgi:hypothetical protein
VLLLSAAGCIVYLEDNPSGGHTLYNTVWLESPYLTCYYDAYWDLSEWQIEIYADSRNGPYEVHYVGFYINNYDYQDMSYWGDGLWTHYIATNYYDCDRSLHFDFVAADYEGYETSYTYYW